MKSDLVLPGIGKRPLVWVRVLIITITLAAVAVTIFLGERTFRETERLATDQFNQQQLILARSATRGIESYFKGLTVGLRSLAKMPSIRQMDPECVRWLEHTYWGFPPRTSLRLLDKNGVLLFVYPNHNWRKDLIGRDYSKEAYFREAARDGRAGVHVVTNERGEARIRVAVAVYSTPGTGTIKSVGGTGVTTTQPDISKPDSDGFCGVLVGSLDPHMIAQNLIRPIVSGRTGYAWLLDDRGVFLSHHEKEFFGRNAFEARDEKNPEISYHTIGEIQRKMLAGEEGLGRYSSGWHRDKTGEIEKLVAYTPVHVDDKVWSVAVCAPVSEVEEVIRASRHSELYTVGFVILVLMTGGLLLLAVSYKWSRSLECQVRNRTEALRESEEQYRAIFESATNALFIFDFDGTVVEANPAACETYGYSHEEMVGLSGKDIVHPEYYHLFENFKKQVKATGQFFTESVDVHKDGSTFDVEVRGTSFTFKGKPHLLAVVRDITERKQSEREKQTLEEQLHQSVKMEAIGRLASGIAHDFNNMLAIIQGYADLMLQSMSADDRHRADVESIRTASKRAAILTRQLLAFGRQQTIQPRVMDLNEVIADTDSMLRRIIGEDIELITIPGKDLWNVKIDPSQIEEQVILNLAVNAREAMPSGGKLTIELSNITLDEDYAAMHAEATPGDYVMLAVSDTGTGMTEEVMSHIFEPFFTTKETTKGGGLGLSIVYGIIKQSGGYISVYSEPGKGTTFRIYLPRVDAPAETARVREPGPLPRGTETVLIAEDEPLVRDLTCRILREQGYTVLEAGNGKEALLTAGKYADGEIHLLITDVIMPHMSGKDLAEQIKALHPKIKVLFVSGYTNNTVTHHGVLQKGVNFLAKPFTSGQIIRTVRRVLDTDI